MAFWDGVAAVSKVKIIANYLPQFHRTPENDEWWGEGYTEWTAVKAAKPLFAGHDQPRIPLNKNYYSLDEVAAIRWQCDLARSYDIYGFGIYHYWFSSEQKLLTKPSELLLCNGDININYMFIWDNSNWIRTWSNVKTNGNVWAPQFEGARDSKSDDGLLAELKYGGKSEWKKH